jgi:hypothetical protein
MRGRIRVHSKMGGENIVGLVIMREATSLKRVIIATVKKGVWESYWMGGK